MRLTWLKRLPLLLTSAVLSVLTTSCFFSSREVDTAETYSFERRNYFRDMLFASDGLSFASANFLRGNLLMRDAEKNPVEVLRKLQEHYAISSDAKYLLIAADFCCWKAASSDEDNAVRYALTAIYYLRKSFQSGKTVRSGDLEQDLMPFQVILTYNECSSVIFEYLNHHALLDHDSFYCEDIEGRRYRFERPSYALSVPKKSLETLTPCSRYSIRNLSLKNCRMGFGVPLVGKVADEPIFHSLRTPRGLTIPVTMTLLLSEDKDSLVHVHLAFFDTTLRENVEQNRGGIERWPLSLDFSTPLAVFLASLPQRNLIGVMLRSDHAESTGLYMIEPYHPGKIPVVFVHGLMSSPETWMQMINTLKNDPVIRKKYQFWFYSYSSGTPVIASAKGLRESLLAVQKEFCTTPEATENFNQMVVVGHSMGGMLTRMLVQEDPHAFPEAFSDMSWEQLRKELSPEEFKVMARYLDIPALPFIHRVVFMAVPHRGAKLAQSPIGRLGVACTNLPSSLQRDFNTIRNYFLKPQNSSPVGKKISDRCLTGIDNLDPENFFVQTLAKTEIKKGVTYHCIIGNRDGDDRPGGTDGVVPYPSSHLDNAASELIVESGHSVHRTPRAIREVLRILRLHIAPGK